ncbi:MAG TPA: hypothetical protein VII45_07245 [Solirubrobacterales bacterium]
MVGCLAASSPAAAEGGTSIAAGPLVPYGQQQFGNTANAGHLGGYEIGSFWNLEVIAGDQVTLDWEAKRGTHLEVFPAGTTDFNFDPGQKFKVQGLNSEGKGELGFTAPQTGTMPMALLTVEEYAGPYSFTAFVKHGLVLALPRVSHLGHVGKITVGVHTPDGGLAAASPIKVKIEARHAGRWLAIGAAPVVGSSARVSVQAPRSLWGSTVALRAAASGSAYGPAKSGARQVSIR